ncbi:MAG: site-specific DNA-methyltransferase [Candidatus Cloacimonetes bacterium HGW-Cloacimonetes-3]|jgi:adenine-specific DNA-methyltransferase|nr:MAG: site-specific DNA-methyltransferase [Candidatus Cloacimonetes bacterium HGW-Cloacimonetes-3]
MPTLNWLGKAEAISAAAKIPYRILKHKPQLSYGAQQNENLLIQGDNLEALKALLPFYAGQVKCIYIDPPYNTRHAFSHYDDNLEHSQWLSLMYPRLELLREFLMPEGSIWISIDDDEGHYLKVICDEVFGRKEFIANVIWEKKFSPQNDAKWLSDSHDHILAYARNKDIWRPNLLPRTEEMDNRYTNPDNDPRGVWTSGDLSVKTYSPDTDYPITTPTGRIVSPPSGYCWRVSTTRLQELIDDKRIWFGASGNNVPRIKRFLVDVQDGSVSKTIWYRAEVGDNQEAKKEIKQFNNDDVFSTPKPERLIKRVFTLGSNSGDLVMDSFLGSGTSAAVAHKMGRRWIGIEMGNHAITHCVPRMQKVIDGEQGGISKAINWQGGGGFGFYTLGEAIFTPSGKVNPEVKFPTLASHIWYLETGSPLHQENPSPLLGKIGDKAYYLLYNGILGDKTVNGGNVLTLKLLDKLPLHTGRKVIYGEASRLSKDRLMELNIIFKQIPYDIKVG